VVLVSQDVEMTRLCLDSVYHLSGAARGRVIAVHNASAEAAILPMLRRVQDEHPDLVVLRNEAKIGFAVSCNRGLFLRERDVVLLGPDALVTEGWLKEMVDVLYSSDRIASVAPLWLRHELDLRSASIPCATDVPASCGPCLLLRDWVLNAIGGFDSAFGRADDAQIDWAMRAQRLGLRHVRANRSVVLGSGSFADEQAEPERGNAALLLGRHPNYLQQVQSGLAGTEGRAAAHLVSSKLRPLQVCIDLQSLAAPTRRATEDLARHLEELPDIEVTLREDEMRDPLERFQVLYRPGAIDNLRDLILLLESPCHLVLGIDDLRPYRIPALFSSRELHLAWRALLYFLAHSAQAVVAASNPDRSELIADLALDPAQVEVVPGVEQLSLPQAAASLASIFRRAVDRPSEKVLRDRTLLANFARSLARNHAMLASVHS
jgi:hypothetical protein